VWCSVVRMRFIFQLLSLTCRGVGRRRKPTTSPSSPPSSSASSSSRSLSSVTILAGICAGNRRQAVCLGPTAYTSSKMAISHASSSSCQPSNMRRCTASRRACLILIQTSRVRGDDSTRESLVPAVVLPRQIPHCPSSQIRG